MLHTLGFKGNETTSKQKKSSEPNQDTQMEINTEITNNTSHGEKLNIIHPNSLRMFYININGMDLGKSDHSLLQLCQTLKSKEVDIICLTETNVHWSPFLIDRFKQILQSTWNKSKIIFCTSKSELQWNSTYKPGGTAIIALKSISSAILNKGQDSSGMRWWTFMSILGKHNKRKTIFNMYRPCNTNLHNAGESTVVRQQWLIMQ